MRIEPIQVTTEDGIPLDGAYLAARSKPPTDLVDCLCFFHGDTGHFYRPFYLALGHRLATEGIAFLSANRRGHDIVANGADDRELQGYAHESVAQAPLDYAAWLGFLRERGHRAIGLAGHSGGAVRAVYTQARTRPADVTAVIALSPGEYDHLGLLELHGDDFAAAYELAGTQVANGRPDPYLRPGIPFDAMWSAGAYLDCFHPDGRYSVTARAAEIDCPTLFVFGTEECFGSQPLPLCGAAMRRLREAAYDHADVLLVDGANHRYEGRAEALFETILTWLRDFQEPVRPRRS